MEKKQAILCDRPTQRSRENENISLHRFNDGVHESNANEIFFASVTKYVLVPIGSDDTAMVLLRLLYGHALADVGQWMSANRLKLNMDKTELLWVGTRHSLSQHGPFPWSTWS